MKTNLLQSALLILGSAAVAWAAPLPVNVTVHTKAAATSPAITQLKAGTEPVPASSGFANTPAGWLAVELAGPFEAYVDSKDLTKSLDVKPGSAMRLEPKADAGVLCLAEKDDKTSITGRRGKWTQISLEKKLVGYINLGGTAGPLPPIATTPAKAARPPVQNAAPVSPPPVAPGVYGVATAGQASAMVNLGDGGSASLPRQFAGKLVSTRRPFTPRRPYDYALNDDAGKRYAYLDISKLLQTEQIEKYIDHHVVVFGAARNTAEGKDIVIAVETLQLK